VQIRVACRHIDILRIPVFSGLTEIEHEHDTTKIAAKMLSSQIASLSQSSISTCLLQSSISSSTVMLRSKGTIRRKPRHDQIRTIRIGLWTSYLDPSFEKEFRRRNKAIKHKYIEAINRKLLWNRYHPGFTRQLGLKGFMCSAWRSQDSRPGGRWVDMDRLYQEKSGPPKSNNSGIEDVETSAFDKLWGKDGFYELLRSRSKAFRNGFDALENSLYHPQSLSKDDLKTTPESASKGRQTYEYGKERSTYQAQYNTDAQPEYEIDPITNRKVFRNQSLDGSRQAIKVPVKTFKGYRSQFQDLQPPEPKPSEEKPAPRSNNDGKTQQSDPDRECLKDYESAETYKPYFAYEPNGEKSESIQGGIEGFDQKASYRWSSWFSSPEKSISDHSHKPCPVQEGLKDYDSRTSYQASARVEPEIKVSEKTDYRDSVQQCLKEFDDTACYGPTKTLNIDVESTEKDTVNLKNSDTKTSYGSILQNESEGKLLAEQHTNVDGLHEFDSKANYNPRRILKNISLTRGAYGTDRSFRWQNEIDTREDLDLLRPSDVRAASGISKKPKKESEAAKIAKRKDLEEDFQKPQSVHSSNVNEMAAARKKEESWNVPNISNGTKKMARKLTGNFVRDFPEEFETKWTPSKEASGTLQPNDRTDSWGYDKTPKGLELSYQHEVENDVQKAEKEYIDGRASKEAFARVLETPRLQTSLDRRSSREAGNKDASSVEQADHDSQPKTGYGLESSYADECIQQTELDPYSKKPQGLEISYADECKQQTELDPYSKKPQGLETSYAEECAAQQGEGDLSVNVSSFGSPQQEKQISSAQSTSRSSLEFNEKNAHKDLGFTTGFSDKDKALLSELRAIYEEKYGKIDLTHRQVSNVATPAPALRTASKDVTKTTSEEQDPTMYKILAYDPTMQSISTAETTSIVSDTEPALTPADVLLRLSNPAKFFPHFEPLQAQGYEIVSGSGDVLVFRKVRKAGLPVTKTETFQNRSGRNPIDGMQGRPIAATGNFASPTGFVNYDRPMPSEPAFKSNIDMRREEPVFSGKSSWAEDEETTNRKKPSLGKRVLVGGAMVGGCSYAIGVVAEYFKSGGADGLGPQSF
jgi:hypothetical protein